MPYQLMEVAQRIRGLRKILEIPVEQIARVLDIAPEEYREYEQGNRDFSITFLLKCAEYFGVDLVELITGEPPKLTEYTLVRKGRGLPIKRRKEFSYTHMAYSMKNAIAVPLNVLVPYHEGDETAPITLSTHEGQEFDMVIRGTLKIAIDGHTEILEEGDTIYYDSSIPHGMIAVGGEDCEFLAMVMRYKQDDTKERE